MTTRGSRAAGAPSAEGEIQVLDTILQVGIGLLDRHAHLELATSRALELLAADTLDEARHLWSHLHPQLVLLVERAGGSAKQARSALEVATKAGPRRLGFEIHALDNRGGYVALIQSAAALEAVEGHVREASRWQAMSRLHRAHVHGMRAPLNNIHLHLHLLFAELGAGDSNPPDLERRLNVIREETARLNRLLDGFFMQMREGVEKERFDLRQVIEETAALLEPQLHAERATMVTHVPREEVLVEGRRDRLRHALVSLAIHALDVAPEGAALAVELEAEPEAARIALRNREGQGIPAEKIIGLLAEGASPPDSALTSTFGIGPIIARSIVESDGGTLAVTSDRGMGAAFVIVLPRARGGRPPASISK